MVAVGALPEDSLGRERRDHRVAPPVLALLDVREVHLDERHLEELERVVDGVRVVRPRARVGDHALRPLERLVAPLDVLALVVRLAAAGGRAELPRPGVDPRLQLGEGQAAVHRRVATVEDVEIHAVEDEDAHWAASLVRT